METEHLEEPILNIESHGLERRDFLKLLLGLTALAWGAMTTYPIFRYLNSSAGQGSDVQVASVSLGKADSFKSNSGKNFKFGSQPALLIKDAAGEFKAYNAVCTHLGCTVQYSSDIQKISCACHGGQYDPNTGLNIAGPPPKPLPALHVEVIDGDVIIKKA